MKALVRSLIVLIGVLSFSSIALAEVKVTLQGKGSTVDAVKAFNRVVASNDGKVDGNSVTEFSSVGIFDEYEAKMYSETDKGKTDIRIDVKRTKGNFLDVAMSNSSNSKNVKIATIIYESMKKLGYHDKEVSPDQK